MASGGGALERKRGTRFGECLESVRWGAITALAVASLGCSGPKWEATGCGWADQVPLRLRLACRVTSSSHFQVQEHYTTVPSPARLPRPHHHIAFCSGSREPPRLSAWHQICPHDHPALILVCCVGAPRTTIFEAHLKVSCRKAVVTRDVRHGCHIVSVDTTTIDEPLLTVLECEGICFQCEKVHRGIILHTP